MTMKLFGTRVLLVAIAAFVLPFVFFETLYHEIGNAFFHAWQDVRINIESVKGKWNGEKE